MNENFRQNSWRNADSIDITA